MSNICQICQSLTSGSLSILRYPNGTDENLYKKKSDAFSIGVGYTMKRTVNDTH